MLSPFYHRLLIGQLRSWDALVLPRVNSPLCSIYTDRNTDMTPCQKVMDLNFSHGFCQSLFGISHIISHPFQLLGCLELPLPKTLKKCILPSENNSYINELDVNCLDWIGVCFILLEAVIFAFRLLMYFLNYDLWSD